METSKSKTRTAGGAREPGASAPAISASAFAVAALAAVALGGAALSCNGGGPEAASGAGPFITTIHPGAAPCQLVPSGQYGPKGTVPISAQKWVTGLEVPWSLVFLPSGDALVSERPGRLRLIRGGQLAPANVMTVPTGETGEGGMLGLALDPGFASNHYFYAYYTAPGPNGGAPVNRVQRFVLSADESSATADRIVLDGIASGTFHDGGRIKFGPDGKLYVSVGDATNPPNAQDPNVPNGKILRLNSDGSIPSDNPSPGKPRFLTGVRNCEAFDWVDSSTLILADNGPTGELGETGADRIILGQSGDNLGWPTIYQCQTGPGLVSAAVSWVDPLPPGGGVIYHGSAIPQWKGDFIVGVLGIAPGGANQLHRVMLGSDGQVAGHEVYLEGPVGGPNSFGRLRDVVEGPDGALYVTTSNCDSRGECPSDGDYVLRLTGG
jgi:glucose/arabinose dehydrogenase